MKRSIQVLAACALTTGYSGIALAQPAPAEHQQHQQHAAPAAPAAQAASPSGNNMMNHAQGGEQPGAHPDGCDCCCCRMMRQMMQGHGQPAAAAQGNEHQGHQAERPN